MGDLIYKLKAVSERKFFKYGIPFLILIVGGSFGLKYFAMLRYQYRKNNLLSAEEVEKYGIKMKKKGEVTLETEYEKIKEMDISNWENIRGPRPWEETEYIEKIKQKQAEKKSRTEKADR
ncbi:cytochrome c oxidase assembly protein COX16 homolog, mitochondrial-like [Limulus polyphemus]|uniref:Cytochrome c oxidase assembly protein COX16 homolog, mitochondrial n=1 Tax=Limulus polyphemus TaxID=6850 RepID=A0ABM1B7T6_LIMPO|nr:cytochrome c oxidase assembly protein COX16 homolog, mitochondrial-like [Limulus polyphemus]